MYRVEGGRAFSNRMGHSTHVTLVSKSQLYFTALAFLEQFTYKCSSFVECPHSRKCSILSVVPARGTTSTLVPTQLSLDHPLLPLYKVISYLIHSSDWKYAENQKNRLRTCSPLLLHPSTSTQHNREFHDPSWAENRMPSCGCQIWLVI